MLIQFLRCFSFLIRNVIPDPIRYVLVDRYKDPFFRWAGSLHARPSFTFYSRQLGIRWSSVGFPDLLTRHMLFEGMYQQDVLLALRKFVHAGDCAIDIGGHHGLMAVIAGKAAGPQGVVVSFEPNPTARRIFLENCKVNDVRNVRLEPLALSDCPGIARFYVQKGNVSWNSSLFADFSSQHGRDEIDQIEVKVTTLDTYVADHGLKPAFIKIDAEGSEFLILHGAMKTIQKYKPIVSMEFNPESAKAANTTVEDMQKALESVGYRLVVLRSMRRGYFRLDRHEPFHPEKHCAGNFSNVLCIPAGR